MPQPALLQAPAAAAGGGRSGQRATPAGLNRLSLLALALALAAAPAGAAQPTQPPHPVDALFIAAGSVARDEVVAIGRDLTVEGDALSDVAAIEGSVRVTGSVAGDVIVLGGRATLAPTARVDGDVFVLGGEIEAASGARIGGRAVSYPTVSSAWLTLLEGPSLGLSPASPVVLGAKLALLAAWAFVLLFLFAVSGRELLATSEAVRREPFRSFAVGLTGVLAMALTALFFSVLAAALVGLPMLALLLLVALVLKLWGMVAVFHALGAWLAARRSRRRVAALHAACLGLLVLGALKLVPWLGVIVWTAATLLGVGATLITKFGRREPWFVLDPSQAIS